MAAVFQDDANAAGRHALAKPAHHAAGHQHILHDLLYTYRVELSSVLPSCSHCRTSQLQPQQGWNGVPHSMRSKLSFYSGKAANLWHWFPQRSTFARPGGAAGFSLEGRRQAQGRA